MTVQANDRRYEYVRNGVATAYPGPRLFSADHVQVFHQDGLNDPVLVDPADYVVTGLGLTNSTITMADGGTNLFDLIILRTVPITQAARITNQGAFLPETHEDAFDYRCMVEQQIADDLAALDLAGIDIDELIASLLVDQDFLDLLTMLITNTFDETDYILQLGMVRMLIPILSAAGTTVAVDKTYESGLVLCTNAGAVTATLRENDGTSVADFSTGCYVSFRQKTVGGQVTVAVTGTDTLSVPRGFLAKTRAIDSTITVTCELASVDGNVWAISGDLAIDPAASSGQAVNALSIVAGVVTVDLALGDFFTLDLTANVTSWVFTHPPAAGYAIHPRIRIHQHASAAKTVAWPASFKWVGAAPTISATLGSYSYLAIPTFDQGTRYEAALSGPFV